MLQIIQNPWKKDTLYWKMIISYHAKIIALITQYLQN